MNADTSTATSAPHWLRGRIARRIFSTDHKQLGLVWVVVGVFGLVIGGVLALVAALQTASADASVVGEGTFASLTTMEGTLLTSVGLLPIALGLALAIVPLQIGARGIASPTLAAAGLWFGVVGSLAVVLSSFASGDAPRSSWTSFPPAVLDPTRPGESVRLMGLLLIALGALLTAVVLVLTLRARRAPGMSDDRLPVFSYAAGIFAAALLVLAPLAIVGNLILLLARANDGFDWYLDGETGLTSGWGLLFQQGIVGITLVPALGAAAEIVATFSRRALAGRKLVLGLFPLVAAAIAITPSADVVDGRAWGAVIALAAAAGGAVIAAVLLPVGLRALAAGKAEALATPLPFAVGTLVLTLLGALASLVFVIQHDELRGTTFESARLGALFAAALLGLAGGAVYWWPKLVGRPLDPRLTSLGALAITGGATLLVVGRAAAGWADQPSHTGVVVDDAGTWSLIGGLGVVGLAGGLALGLLAVIAGANGRRVGNDPWHADTLEWYTSSPPPAWNFDTLPEIASERPLADLRDTLRARGSL